MSRQLLRRGCSPFDTRVSCLTFCWALLFVIVLIPFEWENFLPSPPPACTTEAPQASAPEAPSVSALDAPQASALEAPSVSAPEAPSVSALGGPQASALEAPSVSAPDAPSASTPARSGSFDSPVALCLSVKQQTDDLLEWVAWHHHIAKVDRIYIIENIDQASEVHTLRSQTVLAQYISAGVVVHLPFLWSPALLKFFKNHQEYAYTICIQSFGLRHEWMALIDADEFIEYPEMVNGTPLASVLEQYTLPEIGSLSINWRFFANHNSTHQRKPAGGTIQNYISCYPLDDSGTKDDNFHIKTILRPCYAQNMLGNPHSFSLLPGYFTVDELGNKLEKPIPKLDHSSTTKIWLNHYVSRSVEENKAKSSRGGGDLSFKTEAFFEMANAAATAICTSACDLITQNRLKFD